MRQFYLIIFTYISFGIHAQNISISGSDSLSHLPIQDIEISIKIAGHHAATEILFTFYNPLDRDLEGDFSFPLNEGETVHDYALQIGDHLRKASMVKKAKATEVFESIVRREVDPGILEKTAGNNYRTRIYPIFSKETKQVLIAFDGPLDHLNNRILKYSRQLNLQALSHNLKIKVEVLDKDNSIKKIKTNLDLKFIKNKNKHYAKFSIEKSKINFDEIEILLENKIKKSTTESFVYQSDSKEIESAFYASILLEPIDSKKADFNKLAVIIDQSYSQINLDKDRLKTLLKSYSERLNIGVIELYGFNIEAKHLGSFKRSNLKRLNKKIDSIIFDGGSKLSALSKLEIDADEILLISDGMFNFDIEKIRFNQPLNILISGSNVNYDLLEDYAKTTKGKSLHLNKLSISKLIDELSYNRIQIFNIQSVNNCVSNLHFNHRNKSLLEVTGLISSDIDQLSFSYGIKNQDERNISFKIYNNENYFGEKIIYRLWAKEELKTLVKSVKENETEIIKLSKASNIVTALTSLIVLEEIEDYKRFNILPPDELLREYYSKLFQDVPVEKTHNSSLKESLISYQKQFKVKPDIKDKLKQKTPTINYSQLSGEKKIITGFVGDTSGEPLIGANVLIKGTTIGAITNFDGIFEIEMPIGANEFVVSYTGFNTQEINIGSYTNSNISISMREDATLVEEVIVVGYRVPRKMYNMAQSKTRVIANEIINIPQKLKGHSAGIDISYISDTLDFLLYKKEINEAKSKKLQLNFLNFVKNTQADSLYKYYLEERNNNKNNPTFYINISKELFTKQKTNLAILVASALLEQKLDHAESLKICAFLLQEMDRHDLAIPILEKVRSSRPFEMQSYRDLSLAYAAIGKPQKAIDMLPECLEFLEYESQQTIILDNELWAIYLKDINGIISRYEHTLTLSEFHKSIYIEPKEEIRITLDWNKNESDLDLYLENDRNESCSYQNKSSDFEANYSFDNTEAYGPEEILVKKLPVGQYEVSIDYYDDDSQDLRSPLICKVTLFRNFGAPNQTSEIKTLLFHEEEGDEILVLKFEQE